MMMTPHENAPLHSFQQSRRASSEAAEKRIARHGRRFLLLQLTALGSLLFWTQLRWPPDPWVAFTLGTVFHGCWLFSLHAAGYAAFHAIVRVGVLETAWIAIGLAPWALLMAEVTVPALLLIGR